MIDTILSRRSVRRWTPETPSRAIIDRVLEAAMNAPSAGNEQAWQFLVLDGETLQKYRLINKNCPTGAPVGILVCCDTRAEKYPGYAPQDCAAATQNILLAVHGLGLGGVWTAVFPDKIAAIRELLDLPVEIVPFSFVPFGTPAAPPASARRFDPARVHFNTWSSR